VIVVARHGLGQESGNLILRQADPLRRLAAAAENGKGIAVMASEFDGDVWVLGVHGGAFLASVRATTGAMGAHSPVEYQWVCRG